MRRWLPLLALLGCTPPSSLDVLLGADADRSGDDGLDGSLGAGLTTFREPVRAREAVRVEVVVPLGADDAPAPGPHPVVVLDHGGFVGPERYRWLAVHLASRGYLVALPAFPLELAILEPGNSRAALDGLRFREAGDGVLAGLPGESVATMGHSLGGVIATMHAAATPQEVDAIVLLASIPAPGTDAETLPAEVLALTGANDGSIAPDEVAEDVRRFPAPWFGVVDGMTHYDWTDDASSGELRRDGEPGRPTAESRRDALRVLDAFLDHVLRDGDTDFGGTFPGVEERDP